MTASTPGDYDTIVVGLGAMGSAAAFHLAQRGQRVLGLEQFQPGHNRGSSHGETRIIRLSYFEHPSYVPLLRRAYALWHELERASGEELLRLTGGIYVGTPDSELVAGSLRSAREHQLPHELLDAAAVRRRFPLFQPADDQVALFEEQAGMLFPERCIATHCRLATQAGADLRYAQPIRRWSATAGGVEVHTTDSTFRAARLVLAAGAWAGPVVGPLGPLGGQPLPLQVERNVVFWLQPRETPEHFSADRFPVFIWDDGANGQYYGLPHHERPGVKVARHHSGVVCDPDTAERSVTPADEAPLRRFVRHAIPPLDGAVAGSAVCLYTNSPDEHFVVDRHPKHTRVVFAAGFSGHGFKFASVIGELLADLATTGRTTPEADFLRLDRLRQGT